MLKMFQVISKLSRQYSQAHINVGKSVPHVPVMLQEVMQCFQPKNNEIFIDMTFGAGGHTVALLECAPNIKVYALDRDPVAFEYAQNLSKSYPDRLIPLLGKFSELPELLKPFGVHLNSVDGFLFDFGCSSMQFDTAKRGFSISKEGPLDMRMDGARFPDAPTAADILEKAEEHDIMKILKVYGEEKQARKISRAIIESRYQFKSLRTTKELCDLVASVYNIEYNTDKLDRPAHVATKTFQALRIFVNNELNELNYSIILAERYLKSGGKIVAITFHSLEDRIVKRHLSGNVINNVVNPLPVKYTDQSLWYDKEDVKCLLNSNWQSFNKHVIVPNDGEISHNPRSRSAKLRCAAKIK